jgi:hypothetical protein
MFSPFNKLEQYTIQHGEDPTLCSSSIAKSLTSEGGICLISAYWYALPSAGTSHSCSVPMTLAVCLMECHISCTALHVPV